MDAASTDARNKHRGFGVVANGGRVSQLDGWALQSRLSSIVATRNVLKQFSVSRGKFKIILNVRCREILHEIGTSGNAIQ